MAQSYVESQPPEPPDPAAALLQLARLKAGLSQRELAERASVPTTMISAYERGKRQPGLATLLRLLNAAGFELRMTLEPHDPRNDVTAVLADHQREAWRRATPVANIS